ncbi:unnamed protein product [Prunus armeniaca]
MSGVAAATDVCQRAQLSCVLEWCGIVHTLELERASQASEVGLVHYTGQGCAGFELGLACYMSLPSWLLGLVHVAWPSATKRVRRHVVDSNRSCNEGVTIKRNSRARPADFGSCFLSAPTPDSSKTSAKRTTKLPSSSPSPSPPQSAAIVAGIHHETGGARQFLTELPTFRSSSSGHQIGRVRPPGIDQATHALQARVVARGQIGRDHIQF